MIIHGKLLLLHVLETPIYFLVSSVLVQHRFNRGLIYSAARTALNGGLQYLLNLFSTV